MPEWFHWELLQTVTPRVRKFPSEPLKALCALHNALMVNSFIECTAK